MSLHLCGFCKEEINIEVDNCALLRMATGNLEFAHLRHYGVEEEAVRQGAGGSGEVSIIKH